MILYFFLYLGLNRYHKVTKHTIVHFNLHWPVLALDPFPVVLDGGARVVGDLGSLPVVLLVGVSLNLDGRLRESIILTGTCAVWRDSSKYNSSSARRLLNIKLAHFSALQSPAWSLSSGSS